MNRIEKNVLGAVAFIYLMRKVLSPRALKIYAVVLSYAGVLFLVSVPHITENLVHAQSAGLPALGMFIFSAVTKTTFVVQILLVFGVASLAWLTLDVLTHVETRQFV